MSDAKETNPNSPEEVPDSLADGTRRKYFYRKMVIHGKAKIPARLAMKMVGPDCAFHLYRNHKPEESHDGDMESDDS